MRPHPRDLDGPLFVESPVHQSVLDVDATGPGPFEIAHVLLEAGRALGRVAPENFEQFFRLGNQHCVMPAPRDADRLMDSAASSKSR
jgi:hypothetical protein